jgi:hypothetical protein
MLVPFNINLNVPLNVAKDATLMQHPQLKNKLGTVSTPEDLYNLLEENGVVTYVNYDPNDEYRTFLEIEDSVALLVEKEIEDGYCSVPAADVPIENLDVCEDPEKISPGYLLQGTPDDDLTLAVLGESSNISPLEIGDILRELEGISNENSELLESTKGCVSEMERITAELESLLGRETKVREVKVNVERLLYQYRVLEPYYRSKYEKLGTILGQFTPRLEKIREIENTKVPERRSWVRRDNAKLSSKRKELSEVEARINSALTQSNELENLKKRIQSEINKLQKTVRKWESEIIEFEAEVLKIRSEIERVKDGLWGFNFQNIQDGNLSIRRTQLASRFNSLASGNLTTKIAQFSGKILVNTPVANNVDRGFTLTIRHTFKDPAGVFAGRDISFTKSGGAVNFAADTTATDTGILFTRLYNIWGDPSKFFAPAERGLTSKKSKVAAELQNAEVAQVDGLYIGNLSTFEDFHYNFEARHNEKTETVKSTVIEPALELAGSPLKELAEKEVQLLLSFGQSFEIIPGDNVTGGSLLKTIVDTVRGSSEQFLKKLDSCRSALNFATEAHEDILRKIEQKKLEYQSVKCATPGEVGVPMKPPGQDPLGKNMGSEDPNDPNITKMCYWVRFAAIATAAGLIPIPGGGGFKYWPIGFTVPTPGGLVKIPLPIVWIPLSVIALPLGVLVIFIGQCGICPSPFVLFCGAQGEKKFIVSLRKTSKFGSDSSKGVFKPINQLGVSIKVPISSILNDMRGKNGDRISIEGFEPVNDPDSQAATISHVRKMTMDNIKKLPNPDPSGVNNTVGRPKTQRISAVKESVSDWIDGLKIADLVLPRDAEKVNPKPTPIADAISGLKLSTQLGLPDLQSPPTVDLRELLRSKLDVDNNEEIEVGVEGMGSTPKVRDSVKRMATIALDKISPAAIGIIAVASPGVNFSNPYVCRQTAQGISTPPIPPAVATGLALIRKVAQDVVDGTSDERLGGLVRSVKRPNQSTINGSHIKRICEALIDIMPPVAIPNPSKVNIKELVKTQENHWRKYSCHSCRT